MDLTLTVSDLLDPISGRWREELVHDTFSPEDAVRVLNTRVNFTHQDVVIWCFTRDGRYSSKSGYKLLEELQEDNSPFPPLPPVEKQLWRNLWKTKTSPKIRHFLWRALSGAVAMKERLRSRGIPVDITCASCGTESETICHVLFHCRFAKDTWARSHIPPPVGVFSRNSVFLNFHYLLACNRNRVISSADHLAFP